MSERAGTVSEPSRCDCRWSEDCPEVPCGCGREQVRLYRDEAYHWRGLHWRTPCLIAALAAPHPSADLALPLSVDERTRLHRLLQHAYSVIDPDAEPKLFEAIYAELKDCPDDRCVPPAADPALPPELREQTDQGDGLLGNTDMGTSTGPQSTSRESDVSPR
jgi:hypothetical protein